MSGRGCLVVVVLSLGVLCACSKSNSERVCDPGATQHCACLASADGVQSCAADGTKWESCVCPNGDGGVQQDAPAGDAAGDAGPDDAGGGDTGPSVVTVAQIAQGQIAVGTVVQLAGVVATSQQFLNRRNASTGDCEWGLFVSAPGIATAEAYSGLFITGNGFPAQIPDGGSNAYCPELGKAATGSPIPDGTQPGDVLTLTGKVASYLPLSACSGVPNVSQVPQLRLTEIAAVQKTGTATVPAPATIAAADIAKLASPTETTFHAQWSGARVRLDNVTVGYPASPVACPDTGYNYVDSYGGITLTPSGLTVGDRVYYRGLGHTTDACMAGPVLCGGNTSGLSLTMVQGAHHLDGCAWALLPNDKCADFSPHSSDCPGSTCAPY
jgi:hypothetical protein